MPPLPDSESFAFDLAELLHPAQAFERPRDVVDDPDLTLNEKRTILIAWASDAGTVEAAPAPRCPPAGRQAVSADEIVQALCFLDEAAGIGGSHASWGRRQARRQAFEDFRARRLRGRQDPGRRGSR